MYIAGHFLPLVHSAITRSLRVLFSFTAVNLRYLVTKFKECAGKFYFNIRRHTLNAFFHIFLNFKDYYYKIYPVTGPTSKNRTGSYPKSVKSTIPCLSFCHKKNFLHNRHNCWRCALLHCYGGGGMQHRLSRHRISVQKNKGTVRVQSVLIYVLRKIMGSISQSHS